MRTRTAVAALLLVSLTACGGTAAPAPDTAPQSATATPGEDLTTEAPRDRAGNDDATSSPVPEALDFSATTVDGEPFEGASLAGRPTLLWFWAPWCPTCRSQIPEVEGYVADHDGELNVVGVGSLDTADAIAAFAEEVDGVTHLEDREGALYRKFEIAEQSSFVLLDASGAVAFETGYGGSDELAAEVDDVVG